MRKLLLYSLLSLSILINFSAIKKSTSELTRNFSFGNPEVSSINKLSFGPEGLLFIGDSKNAMIHVIETKDVTKSQKSSKIAIKDFDEKIANALGSTAKNIKITDMAVNPISKTPYFSIHLQDGTPVLLKLIAGELKNVSLKNVSFSQTNLLDAVAVDSKDKRGRALRTWAISDLKYHENKVYVSGLSNKEFASTFRSINFPFTKEQDYASLEIYHAAHGRYETYAPIKTFNIIKIKKEDYLLASYTCTPLVLFPLKNLQNKKHVKGRTIAELGGGNSPIDMISFYKGDELKLYMSNTNRPIMRINFNDIVNFKDSITTEVKEFGKDTGLTYDNLPFVNVQQFDDLDDDNVLLLRRRNDGVLYLHNRSKKWL